MEKNSGKWCFYKLIILPLIKLKRGLPTYATDFTEVIFINCKISKKKKKSNNTNLP